MAFCDQLAETEISSELMYKLSQVRSWHSKALRLVHWRNWPEVTKWTLEALAISTLVAFVAVIGWPKLTEMLPAPRPDMTLAQVEKEKDKVPLSPEEQMSSKEGSDSAAPNLFAANENQNSSTSEPKVESKPKESDESVKKDAEASAQKQAAKKAEPKKTTAISIAKSDKPKVESGALAAAGDSAIESAKLKSMKPKPAKPRLKGFVYRVYMDLGDLDYVTEQIRAEIQTLGGKKAGKVRLGWRKPKGSYFHFSMPEVNYDTLVDKLKAFGPVRIFKDPHWKVMPQGEIRFILWVEDKDLKEATQTSGGAASAADSRQSVSPLSPDATEVTGGTEESAGDSAPEVSEGETTN